VMPAHRFAAYRSGSSKCTHAAGAAQFVAKRKFWKLSRWRDKLDIRERAAFPDLEKV
jgi:hypothetical protein